MNIFVSQKKKEIKSIGLFEANPTMFAGYFDGSNSLQTVFILNLPSLSFFNYMELQKTETETEKQMIEYLNMNTFFLSFNLNVFGDWQNESISVYVNDSLVGLYNFKIPNNGWKYNPKTDWQYYNVCSLCNQFQNTYSTFYDRIVWTQNNSISTFQCTLICCQHVFFLM